MTQLNQFNKAIPHFKNGAFEAAASLCGEFLSWNPDNSDALYLLGLIAYKTNNAGRAVDLFIMCYLSINKEALFDQK